MLYGPFGSFQESGAVIQTPNSKNSMARIESGAIDPKEQGSSHIRTPRTLQLHRNSRICRLLE